MNCYSVHWILCLSFLILSHKFVKCSKKQWLRNANFDNPNNWDAGRLPCPEDTLIFPEPSPAVYLNSNITVSTVFQLPKNGQFMLGDRFSLSATSQEGQSPRVSRSTLVQGQNGSDVCNGSMEVTFNRTEPYHWLNPYNWCTLSKDGKCQENTLLLDSEQVPCINDDVIFPPKNTFIVGIEANIKAKSLSISQNTYTSGNISTYLQSDSGQKQFRFVSNSLTITLTGQPCTENTGCPCGNDREEILSKICRWKTTAPSVCPPFWCDQALVPQGHCCNVCGAVLTADYGFGFSLDNLRRVLQNRFVKDSDIKLIISKTGNDKIQIVVSDNQNDGEKAKPIAKDIYTYLKRDIIDTKLLGLTGTDIQSSGKSTYKSASQQSSKKQVDYAHIFGIIGAVVTVLAVIAVAMYCFVDRGQCARIRDKIPTSVTFRRFNSNDPNEDNVEMAENSVSYIDIMNRMEQQTTFDNPMFGVADPKDPNDMFEEDITDTIPDKSKKATKKKKKSSTKDGAVINNNDGPAIIDAADIGTFEDKHPNAMPRGNSFSNPLFASGSGSISNGDYLDDSETHGVIDVGEIDDSHI